MSADDKIGYRGPDLTYHPTTGSNAQTVKDRYRTPRQRSYADTDVLDRLLTTLLNATDRFREELESELIAYSMPIPRADERLIEANTLEWPSDLGAPKPIISYRYYRALSTRTTTSASYVRSRFQDAMRDLTGTVALDLLELVEVIASEARLVKDFVPTYIGDVEDSAELRTIELFQDWASAATNHLNSLYELYTNRGVHVLPAAEVERASQSEARQAQATYKLKLNATNKELTDSIAYLKKNFSEHAATFYGRFLGPSMQWRLAAGRSFHAQGGTMGTDMTTTNNSLDANLSVLQADQLRRNKIFDEKIGEIAVQVQRQDAFRDYITQLAPKGKAVTVGMPDTVALMEDDPEEIEYWEDLEANLPEPLQVFTSLHSSLGGIDLDDAHPQYLLNTGDLLTGDLILSDGVKIDGMEPAFHRHTGQDGTNKIRGADILGGSVTPEVIDHTVLPETPTDLRLVGQDARVVPPGTTVVDVQLSWEGDTALNYEVQHTVLR